MLTEFFIELSLTVQIFLVIAVCIAVLKTYLVFTMGICLSSNRLDGKTVIVTGASAGIGKETALDLAHRGARVILACRDLKKASIVKDDITKETGNQNVLIKELDLASFSSVRKFAAGILQSESRLDVLINNAGCGGITTKQVTEDGLENQMQSNYFGHFLLTNLLLGLLKKTAPSRIINVSSLAHAWTKDLNFNNLNSEISYDPATVYYNSKLCQILSARYLAPLIIKSGVTVNSLHPGVVSTEFLRNSPLWVRFLGGFLMRFLFKSSKEGAQTSIHLAVTNEVAGVTGEYFSDCTICSPSEAATNDGLAKKLWETSEAIVKLEPKERQY